MSSGWDNIKIGLKLLRPFTLFLPLVSAIFFSIIALRYYHEMDNIWSFAPTIIAGAIALSLSNGVSNCINQVSDRTEDSVHPEKSKRPVASGQITETQALSLAIAGLIISFFFAGQVNKRFVTFLSLIYLGTFIYSMPPIRLKKRLFWNNLIIAVVRGFIGPLATFAIVGNAFEPPFLIIALVMFTFTLGLNPLKDVPDVDSDKSAGVRNFCTEYGVRTAMLISIPFVFLPYLYILFFTWTGFLVSNAIYLLLLIPIGVLIVYSILRIPQKKVVTENTVLWLLFYANSMLYVVGFACIYFL
ncbi:MAG: UbiA family prenyltransferase [Candidatus Aenigmarchaeota archaeon]|nr:UbiA family prenyltransferase [Candidatus Aenigmarchaeota archaeon]